MRAEPTEAERILWQRLRHDLDLAGSHFRRQAQIGPFIVDFVSRKAKLVIEVDGDQHDWQQEEDAARTRKIEALGYRGDALLEQRCPGKHRRCTSRNSARVDPHPRPLPARGGETRPPRRPRKMRRLGKA
ncbi:endonuclease domain-containing protein [Bradyrhizobium sp. SZCCHNRI3043]|uniref:endonuclease domain-containing protein n=1 Tax=Bradyrhizobium sp. SZCCHNRI3043 TaxID=3057292 RepID=UPI0028ECB9D2|nr:endonuclease domain-containing protein [Bradyrhizobium sp. SZCCHNRI3043]